ncbi:hypothetical protein [Bacillus toyonensis]|uniref:hypothetical protein n=1 Tax=Bacillus toyonensis TaxID=155322 RepID=UPI002E1CD757|nr:hypothetical protein [Bacillus toyonensis]
MEETLHLLFNEGIDIKECSRDIEISNAEVQEVLLENGECLIRISLNDTVESFLNKFVKTRSYFLINIHTRFTSSIQFIEQINNKSMIWNRMNINKILCNLGFSKRYMELEFDNAALCRLLDEDMVEIETVLLPNFMDAEISDVLDQYESNGNHSSGPHHSAMSWLKRKDGVTPEYIMKKSTVYSKESNIRIKIGEANPRVIIASLEKGELYGVIPYNETPYSTLYIFKSNEKFIERLRNVQSMKKLILGENENKRKKEFKKSLSNRFRVRTNLHNYTVGDIVEWNDDKGVRQKGMYSYQADSSEDAEMIYLMEKQLTNESIRNENEDRRLVTNWNGVIGNEGPYTIVHATKILKREVRYEYFGIPTKKIINSLLLDEGSIMEEIKNFAIEADPSSSNIGIDYNHRDYSNAMYDSDKDEIVFYLNRIHHTAAKNYMEEDITLEETINLIASTMNGNASQRAEKIFKEIMGLAVEKQELMYEMNRYLYSIPSKEHLSTIEAAVKVTEEYYKKLVYYKYVVWEEGRNFVERHLLYKYDSDGYKAYKEVYEMQEKELIELNMNRNIARSALNLEQEIKVE